MCRGRKFRVPRGQDDSGNHDGDDVADELKLGDFSRLAKEYVNRPGYSDVVLDLLCRYVGADAKNNFCVADVGAGTGKLTEQLLQRKLNVVAVEPNDAMREEGIVYTSQFEVAWKSGSGEATGLPSGSVDWVLMGSSFHWVNLKSGLTEFNRILRPGGFFTALWNPRNIEASQLHRAIEDRIYQIAPHIERKSSGGKQYTETLIDDLVSTGHFMDAVFVEAKHDVHMSRERYLGAWRSVNDIQVQAGPEKFEEILTAIANEISSQSEIVVPYLTRAWTVTRSTR